MSSESQSNTHLRPSTQSTGSTLPRVTTLMSSSTPLMKSTLTPTLTLTSTSRSSPQLLRHLSSRAGSLGSIVVTGSDLDDDPFFHENDTTTSMQGGLESQSQQLNEQALSKERLLEVQVELLQSRLQRRNALLEVRYSFIHT